MTPARTLRTRPAARNAANNGDVVTLANSRRDARLSLIKRSEIYNCDQTPKHSSDPGQNPG
ncbi:hypothetical protein Raf01_04620 [Rugosimonospora africana]|uniref:Uncharacterized protein n=1 Tax=Rugosimonospora africana TaxID=556532 RepID=A0A8J3QMA1_9ACTN|nr:hypothetical protein Raf01_04620 [Rugosimonospora africana]